MVSKTKSNLKQDDSVKNQADPAIAYSTGGMFTPEHVNFYYGELSQSLEKQLRYAHRPEERKTLRKFSPAEAADFIGMPAHNMRMKFLDGTLPEIETDARGFRQFSAEDIWTIRHILSANKDNKYLPGRRPGDKMQVIATANFKGGSGKSTTVIHLAQRYALKGYRVLAVDMDPQASLTTLFGYRPEIEFTDRGTLYDALSYDEDQVPIRDIIRKTYFHNLDLAPGGLMLSDFETSSAYALARDNPGPNFFERLKAQLKTVEDDYDIVIIDCPPNLGFLTLSAIGAATGMLITVIPGMLDISSMSQFLKLIGETLDTVRRNMGTKIEWHFMKFLITRHEPNDGPQAQMVGYMRTILGPAVMTNMMLKSSAIGDAYSTHQSVIEVDPANFVRKTLDRAVSSINAVADELEIDIQRVWGRKPNGS